MEEGEINEMDCVICLLNTFKYKCPNCENGKTCSLECSRNHSKICSNSNRSVKFIPLEEFTDVQINKDFVFLEKIGRSINQVNNQTSKKPKINWIEFSKKLEINVNLLPTSFSKHIRNTTKLKAGVLEWTIEIKIRRLFQNENNVPLAIKEDNIKEIQNTKMLEASNEELTNTQLIPHLIQETKVLDGILGFNSVREILDKNVGNFNDIVHLETWTQNQSKWVQIENIDEQLNTILKGKTILEFPTFRITQFINIMAQ